MNHKIPDHCKGCIHLHTSGVKDGKHDRWCCKFSKAAPKAVGHCKNVGGKNEGDQRHNSN